MRGRFRNLNQLNSHRVQGASDLVRRMSMGWSRQEYEAKISGEADSEMRRTEKQEKSLSRCAGKTRGNHVEHSTFCGARRVSMVQRE